MPSVTLYTPDRDADSFKEAEALLETAYLDYDTEISNETVPRLEIERGEKQEIYKGLNEIRQGLDNTDLKDLERRF